MADDIFKDRERALEGQWARAHDAELIEKLRQKEILDALSTALSEKLGVSSPDVLLRVIALGTTTETAPALLLAPLVEVAWAEGHVTEPERQAVLRLAAAHGIAAAGPAAVQLTEWLSARPSDELFATAVDVIKAGLAALPAGEREGRLATLASGCREVAEASGGLGHKLGLTSGVSSQEHSTLDRILAALRA